MYTTKPIYTYDICICMCLAFGSPVRVLLLTVFFVLFSVLLLLVLAFRLASSFNGEVSSWDVSSVTTMYGSKWKVALPS